MDKGIIYIALLDDSKMDSYNGKVISPDRENQGKTIL